MGVFRLQAKPSGRFFLRVGIALAALTLCLCGCYSEQSRGSSSIKEPFDPGNKAGTEAIRNNALDLLHDLLGDEKNLSKVLLIKHASPKVKQLVKSISTTSKSALETLDAFAKAGAAPAWDHLALPPGEKATRDSISKAKEHELLHSSGDEFEFQLLLSQAEGLNYGAHLAKVAAENELDAVRRSKLLTISRELQELLADVLGQLRTRNG